MRTSLECMPCFVRQTLDACSMSTDNTAVHEQILRDVLRWMSEMNMNDPPPVLARRIHNRLRELTGVVDPYARHKSDHNKMALALLPSLRGQIEQSPDPLMCAAHLAIAGNIIDLGVKHGLQESEVQEAIQHAVEIPLEGDTELFRSELAAAKSILYLADNAGEIVFDRLLIEHLGPDRVTVAVRGKPIINDATLQDAHEAGLAEIVDVIDNGDDVPGTWLETCSENFRRHFYSADLIISKGQGNFETLNERTENIFFLFKVKCPAVVSSAGMPLSTHVLRSYRRIQS